MARRALRRAPPAPRCPRRAWRACGFRSAAGSARSACRGKRRRRPAPRSRPARGGARRRGSRGRRRPGREEIDGDPPRPAFHPRVERLGEETRAGLRGDATCKRQARFAQGLAAHKQDHGLAGAQDPSNLGDSLGCDRRSTLDGRQRAGPSASFQEASAGRMRSRPDPAGPSPRPRRLRRRAPPSGYRPKSAPSPRRAATPSTSEVSGASYSLW